MKPINEKWLEDAEDDIRIQLRISNAGLVEKFDAILYH